MPINSRMEMLLQQKDINYLWNPNLWCFFGGKIEPGETASETRDREWSEEIGNKNLLENVYFFRHFPFYDVHSGNGTIRKGILYVYSADFVGNPSEIKLK